MGIVKVPGSSSWDAGTGVLTIKGSGSDIGGQDDSGHFTFIRSTGKVTIVARVTGLSNIDANTKVGLMIRANPWMSSPNIFLACTPANGVKFQSRADGGMGTNTVSAGSATAPVWLKLECEGDLCKAWRSVDGTTWDYVGSETIFFWSATLRVGFAITSHSENTLATATFDNISITSTGQDSLPSPWMKDYLGNPNPDGSAAYSNGAFTIEGRGPNSGAVMDYGCYVHQSIDDVNCTRITAKLTSFQAPNSDSRAGIAVMVPGYPYSNYVFLGVSGDNRIIFESADTESSAVTQVDDINTSVPVYLRLEYCFGAGVSGWVSSNGIDWTLIETAQVSQYFGPTNGGMIVTSHSETEFANAVFENLDIKSYSDPLPDRQSSLMWSYGGASYWDEGKYILIGKGTTEESNDYEILNNTDRNGSVSSLIEIAPLGPVGTKAGLICRDSESTFPVYVALMLVNGQGLVLERRSEGYGPVTSTVLDPNAVGPIWLKLETRYLNTVIAYSSADGITWNQVASVVGATIPDVPKFLGATVSSGSSDLYATATFSHYKYVNGDMDGDGLGDWWEQLYFGNLDANPQDPVPAGFGLSIWEAYLYRYNPLDFYLGAPVVLATVSGNNQAGLPGTFLPVPLKVRVTNPEGHHYGNSPVTFKVTSGNGSISQTLGGTTSQSITLLTGNYTGYAEVWCKLPESGDPTVITVTTGVVEPLTFTASIGRPAMSVLAHWSLNDGSTQILDSSAQLNHGTAVGAPGTGLTGTAQGDGLAIHLDGIGQYATVPHASSLSLGQRSFTLHGWFKAESTNTVSPLLFKGKTDSTGFHGYYLGLDATGALEFRLGTNGSSSGEVSFATQGTYDDGRWHQAIVVVDRLTKQIQLYVDGAARPVQLRSGSLGSISTAPGSHGTIVNVSAALTLDADTTEPLLIGADLTSGQNHFFAGGLDEFKIYTPDLVPLQLTAVTDSDSDGIADAWEMQIFGNLSNTPSLPSPWQAANIGTSLTGVSAYSSGVFTSYGMGLDIGGTQDSFRYVYQTFQGEGTVVGQVDGPANGGTSARAGLMLRASLDPAAANVSLLLIPGQGLVLQQRATTGGTTTQTVLEATATGPLWLKLERVGSSIKAYSSTDGLTWELLTTVPTPAGFPSQALAGFALTSNDETKIASATFTQGQFLATDTNNDGIGDGWALHYFGTIEIDPEALTPSGDGRTLLEV
ncbi:MAG TPA: LamG-like jellyroll fold domain-containing protein, partial [Candidatus Methylacidiphilales bacterium]|nr:LamG-like jellyroll fold domain-containing protein [Candidatus Methylacidiphilales bacterium]